MTDRASTGRPDIDLSHGAGTGLRQGEASGRAEIVWFVALAYGLSWTWWLSVATSGAVVDPGDGWPTHLPGLMGPALAAVVVTAVAEGRRGLADLGSRMVRWRVGWVWFALIGATGAMALVPAVTGSGGGAGDVLRYSGAPPAGLAVVLYVLVVNGFGEEVGWRGFLADRLLRDRSQGRTALIVWAVWAPWHLPLFLIVGNFRDFGVAGTVGWVVGIGFGSLLLTWLYQSACRSVLIVALWHTAYNFATATEAANGVPAAIASSAVIVGSVVILRRPATWRKPPPSTPDLPGAQALG
jgi:membrane protease YdiL (CAAX protease family)